MGLKHEAGRSFSQIESPVIPAREGDASLPGAEMRSYGEGELARQTGKGPWRVPKLLLSAAEVAESLAVSTSLVFRWVRQGRLPAVRHPNHQLVRIRPEDLERFLNDEWKVVEGPVRPPRGQRGPKQATRGRVASR